MHAKGTFEVKVAPQPADDYADAKLQGRMTIDKQWQGNIEGTSKGQMLTGMSEVKGSGAYVAIEVFTGAIGGKRGTLTFHHTGIMERGAPSLTILIVPDSGTGALSGITGKLTIDIKDGKHFYDLEYSLPAAQ